MKINFHLLSCFVYGSILFIASVASSASPADYLIVKDLPFIKDATDLSGYYSGLFQLGIGIAVTLAIVVGVINGLQYMFSDVPGIKLNAKNKAGVIIRGLLFAFSGWLILYTINPHLVKFDLITSLEEAADAAARDIPPNSGGQGPAVPTTPTSPPGSPWPDDAKERAALQAAGISVKTPTCTKVDQKGCTSVYGLSQSTIAGLINLKARCVREQPSCNITITGGTEYWLHNTHGNNRTVDLRANPSLTSYIGGQGTKCFQARPKDGLTFHWEDKKCGLGVAPHWHVTF